MMFMLLGQINVKKGNILVLRLKNYNAITVILLIGVINLSYWHSIRYFLVNFFMCIS